MEDQTIFDREKHHMIGKISLADFRDATFGHGPYANRPYEAIKALLQVADIYKQAIDSYDAQFTRYDTVISNYQKIIKLKDTLIDKINEVHASVIDIILVAVDYVLFLITIGVLNIHLF